MSPQLLNITMNDGSRQFGELPQSVLWYELKDHIAQLPGVTGFVTDGVTEAWIDFTYQGQEFSVNDQFGDYWFFVKEPSCPDAVLESVLAHCASVLDN